MKILFIAILGVIGTISLQAKTYNMQELGADITGKVKCTELINQTIEKAAAEGGGTLYFPAGNYLTAAIKMKSNITLDIESGAVISFSDDFEDYLPFVRMRWEGVFMNSFSPLFYAENAENITIKGRVKIVGIGHIWCRESMRLIQ